MIGRRDTAHYRREAARYRELAAAATDSVMLRDSYLASRLNMNSLRKFWRRASGASGGP
jgi:hypothetical protein